MKKYRLKEVALLTMLSSMLLSGCGKTSNKEPQTTTQIQSTTETFIEDEIVSNQTIAKIYEEYINISNNNIDIKDLKIEEFIKPNIYKKGVNYYYDFRINGYSGEEYEYIDPGYHGKMYAVIVKTDENYEPIAALANINGDIFNVHVTFDKDNQIYEPSENYIIINNPTKEDYENIKNADEYIYSNNREAALSKEVNDVILLQKKITK